MQRFGYYESVFQIGRSDGLNNAFWLSTPAGHGNDVDGLEIDISEAHAHNDSHMTVHDWQPVHVGSGDTLSVPEIYPGYHTSGLEWATDGTLRWYWDGELVRTFAPSQLAAYESMLPLQVMFSTKGIPFAGTPGPTMDGSSMNIANVRVWMKPGWEGADSSNWGTVSNWGPDGVPDAGDAAIFNRATSRTTVSPSWRQEREGTLLHHAQLPGHDTRLRFIQAAARRARIRHWRGWHRDERRRDHCADDQHCDPGPQRPHLCQL